MGVLVAAVELFAIGFTTVRVFLLPRPARGLETVLLGTNKAPPRAGAFEPEGRGTVDCRLSSDSCNVLPPNIMGSECSRNLPASCGRAAREYQSSIA